MNKKFTIEVNDTICILCYCEDEKFLHHVWDGEKGHKICTSCVLFENIKSFCPTCFDLLDDPYSRIDLIRCLKCGSHTHDRCISYIDKYFECSSCTNPDHLIFHLKELPQKEDDGHYKLMDSEAAGLLLTAAKIVKRLISKAHGELIYSAAIQATYTISDKEKARNEVKRFMKFEECDSGPSLLDSSPETSMETAN